MAIELFNTMSRTVERFEPLNPPHVRMYTCGPTVYNHAHIGNFRAYIFEDLLQRHLEFRGYTVERVMNLTDVDDKTIRGCREAAVSLAQFTQQYKEAFFEDLSTLRIKPANAYPAATEDRYIARMIEMIGTLIEKGYAYKAEDGSVYYRLRMFPAYGNLAHLNLDELRPSGRVASDEYEKENIGDFALWKAWDENDGEVAWDSPWGRGRPGWHIECSAMATELLGPEIDIHCGAVDNIFPHHEAEIAQTEACTGCKFVKYWVHCLHLIVDGQKMSKSLGNFFTLRDLLAKGFTGREIRYVLIASHYRAPLNFTFEGVEAARSSLHRLDEWTDRLREVAGDANPDDAYRLPAMEDYGNALDYDLNIAGALGHLFDTVRDTNRALDEGTFTPGMAAKVLAWWNAINAVLAFEKEEEAIPREVHDLVERRKVARAGKEWALSDKLRDEITALGYEVKDARDGVKITKL
jgi:cysteinyl-tRNA synthetase